jgi:hypothetical protein
VFKKKSQLVLDGVHKRLVLRQIFFFLNTRNACAYNWRKFYLDSTNRLRVNANSLFFFWAILPPGRATRWG